MDFNVRICAIRETFEEINTLIAKTLKDGEAVSLKKYDRIDYSNNYNSNFLSFCKTNQIVPVLSAIYGYRRVSSGYQIIPGIDNQFYLYFSDDANIVKQI